MKQKNSKKPAKSKSEAPPPPPSSVEKLDDLERLITAGTHEMRNLINSIALEIAYLLESESEAADDKYKKQFERWMPEMQFCSSLLKRLREKHSSICGSEDENQDTVALSQFVQKLREKKFKQEGRG